MLTQWRYRQRRSCFLSTSLPFGRTGEEPLPVKDQTSGPGAPDLELIWFPLTVFDDKFAKPQPGTHGVTLVCHHTFESVVSPQILSSRPAGRPVAAPREHGNHHAEVAQHLGRTPD